MYKIENKASFIFESVCMDHNIEITSIQSGNIKNDMRHLLLSL